MIEMSLERLVRGQIIQDRYFRFDSEYNGKSLEYFVQGNDVIDSCLHKAIHNVWGINNRRRAS